MYIPEEKYKKLKFFFTVFSQNISSLQAKRRKMLSAYLEKKTKRAHKEILEKIKKM